jgi:hypothetical protein
MEKVVFVIAPEGFNDHELPEANELPESITSGRSLAL